jgi:hypothetical protein
VNKFGLLHEEEEISQAPPDSFSEKLAAFPATSARRRVDLAAVDAAAAPHGFVSREAASPGLSARRRRFTPLEPTRHLAIRLTSTQYDRFVAYADKHKLTYHEALVRLLETSPD